MLTLPSLLRAFYDAIVFCDSSLLAEQKEVYRRRCRGTALLNSKTESDNYRRVAVGSLEPVRFLYGEIQKTRPGIKGTAAEGIGGKGSGKFTIFIGTYGISRGRAVFDGEQVDNIPEPVIVRIISLPDTRRSFRYI
jgi:hypothetical protein